MVVEGFVLQLTKQRHGAKCRVSTQHDYGLRNNWGQCFANRKWAQLIVLWLDERNSAKMTAAARYIAA